MALVQVHATGEEIDVPAGPLLDYYWGEANTVGGYTIDGAEFRRKIAASDFDPGEHTVDEVQQHLAISMPGEVARVLEAERAGQARVTLLRDYELPDVEQLPEGQVDEMPAGEQWHPGFEHVPTQVEAPADGAEVEISSEPESD